MNKITIESLSILLDNKLESIKNDLNYIKVDLKEIKIFNLNAEVEKIATRRGDGSVVVTLATQQLDPKQAGYLMMLQNKNVYFFLSEKEFQANQLTIPDEPKETPNKFTKSQRLRFTLFDLFKSEGVTDNAELEKRYQERMEEIINFYNSKNKK